MMNIAPDHRGATLRAVDMELLTQLSMLRSPEPSAERRRVESARTLLDSASELNRALSLLIKHALVHCQGTPGCADLEADNRALAAAIAEYTREADRVRDQRPEELERLVVGECCDVKPTSPPRETKVRRIAAPARLYPPPENARAR
jgi:hypothetical protein